MHPTLEEHQLCETSLTRTSSSLAQLFKIKPANLPAAHSVLECNLIPVQPRPLTSKMAEVKELENFINGEFVPCSKHVDSYNPALGKVHLKIPDSGKEEVDSAVQAAKVAFKKLAL